MRVKLTVVGYYDLPTDPDKLLEAWDTTDPREALKLDQAQFEQDMYAAVDCMQELISVVVEEAEAS